MAAMEHPPLVSLEAERARLEARLGELEVWRALQQLLAREAAGEWFDVVEGGLLREKLEQELAASEPARALAAVKQRIAAGATAPQPDGAAAREPIAILPPPLAAPPPVAASPAQLLPRGLFEPAAGRTSVAKAEVAPPAARKPAASKGPRTVIGPSLRGEASPPALSAILDAPRGSAVGDSAEAQVTIIPRGPRGSLPPPLPSDDRNPRRPILPGYAIPLAKPGSSDLEASVTIRPRAGTAAASPGSPPPKGNGTDSKVSRFLKTLTGE